MRRIILNRKYIVKLATRWLNSDKELIYLSTVS